MTIYLITLFASSTALTIALWVRQSGISGSSAHERYYLTAALVVSGILTLVTLLRLIRFYRRRPVVDDDAEQQPSPQLRQHYRIQFDESSYPVFVQKTEDPLPVTAFSCPVGNISETGISLVCTGVYDHGQTVQGEIIFNSGHTAPINAIVIREDAQCTTLRLHCTIDPPLLMAEQREQIVLRKAEGPQPAVSKTILDGTAGSLPSHTPKGICRVK
jgi:hypothetical protein